MRRFISLLLTLSMVVTILSGGVFAHQPENDFLPVDSGEAFGHQPDYDSLPVDSWYPELEEAFEELLYEVALVEALEDSLGMTAHQEYFLDLLNYDNVVAMARKLSEAPFGSRVGGSIRMDMTVEYLMSRLSEWGYDPWIHHFDTTGPTFNALGGSPNRRFNNGYVQIGNMRYMFYGPAFGANTVYRWSAPGGSVTRTAIGTAVIPWLCHPHEHLPAAQRAAAAFPAESFVIPEGVNVSGRVVFVPLGSGPTQVAAGMIHPTGERIHEVALLLQTAGAAAVVFQSRLARYSFVSDLPPFNSDPADPDTWTWGDSVHGRLANQTTGAVINIPVGLTSHWEIHETIEGFGTGDNTRIRVHMETRSDGQNVMARHYGFGENAKNIYLGNHPDSVVSAPGFNDTIVTTALQMEMMRVLAEYDIQTYHNIVFAAWDFEENGLLGARYYVYDMTEEAQEQFWGNFNMDMVATGQPECIYIHVNITTPLFGTAQTTNPVAPVGNLQFYLRQIQDNQRLIDHPAAFAYANQFGVFINSFLAVQQLAENGRHEDRVIVVDPTHHRYGEPFDISYHFTITWGQTTDQAAFVQPALGMHTGEPQVHENLANAMQFDWRRNARGFVGGQFPEGWQPGQQATLAGLGIVPVLELLYHKVGDTYEDNFSRDRLEVIGDIVWLALYHSAEVAQSGVVIIPDFLTESAAENVGVYITAGMLPWDANEARLTGTSTNVAHAGDVQLVFDVFGPEGYELEGFLATEPGWHTIFSRGVGANRLLYHMVKTYFYVPAELFEDLEPGEFNTKNVLIETNRRNPSFQSVHPATGIRHVGETHASTAIIRLPAIEDRHAPGGNFAQVPAVLDAEGNRLPGQTWALGSDVAPFDPNNFNTPAIRNMIFCEDTGMLTGLVDPYRSLYAFTTLAETDGFFNELLASPVNGANTYRFNVGFSPHNFAHLNNIEHFWNDIMIFTATDLSAVDCWAEAGALLQANDKPTLFTYTGVHGHEQSSQEGALALAYALAATEWGVEVLQDVNIVMYLGVNASGNYQMVRGTSNVPYAARTAEGRPGQFSHDGNRDFLLLHTQEITQLHQVWLAFMPEISVDGHEIGSGSYNASGWMNGADDHQLQMTATPEVDPRLIGLGADLIGRNFEDGLDAGVRFAYYEVVIVNGSVGNHFFGLWGGMSFIFETRGQSSMHILRRAYSTYASYRSMIEFVRENAEEIVETVAEVREDLVTGGSTYTPYEDIDLDNPNTFLVIHQNRVPAIAELETRMPQVQRWNVHWQGALGLGYAPGVMGQIRRVADLEVRTRPTGYIVPLEINWDTHTDNPAFPNNDYEQAFADLLFRLRSHNIEYYVFEPGVTVPLQQYWVSSAQTSPRGANVAESVAFTTSLRAMEEITFDVPVLFIPMDQIATNIIGDIMEPDMSKAFREGNHVTMSWVQGLMTMPAPGGGNHGTVRYDQTRTLLHCPVTMNLPIFRLTLDNPRDAVAPPQVGEFSLDIFNNGEGGSPSTPNEGLYQAGIIRMWPRLDGEGTTLPYPNLSITATFPDGTSAMQFVRVNRVWVDGQGWQDYFLSIDVLKGDGDWEIINFSITEFGQTVEVVLVNNRFVQPPEFTFDIFNNGEGGSPSIPNASLYQAGFVRMWVQLDGVVASLPYPNLSITATLPNGTSAMQFVRVNRAWVEGQGWQDHFSSIDILKGNGDWEIINFSITVFNQTVEVVLVNNRFVPPVLTPEYELETTPEYDLEQGQEPEPEYELEPEPEYEAEYDTE